MSIRLTLWFSVSLNVVRVGRSFVVPTVNLSFKPRFLMIGLVI